MNLEEIIEKLSNSKLSEYQIQELDKQIDQYINNNNTALSPIVEVCPKCGLSKLQVCIMTALSRGNNVYIHTYNTDRPTDVDAHQLCKLIEEETYCFLDGIKFMTGV